MSLYSVITNKHRGMLLESIINRTIKKYEQNNLALFHKKEVPINFSGIHSKDKSLIIERA